MDLSDAQGNGDGLGLQQRPPPPRNGYQHELSSSLGRNTSAIQGHGAPTVPF